MQKERKHPKTNQNVVQPEKAKGDTKHTTYKAKRYTANAMIVRVWLSSFNNPKRRYKSAMLDS